MENTAKYSCAVWR